MRAQKIPKVKPGRQMTVFQAVMHNEPLLKHVSLYKQKTL